MKGQIVEILSFSSPCPEREQLQFLIYLAKQGVFDMIGVY
jgi:hypothetical protein